MKTMQLEQLDRLESIDPKLMAPWIPPAFAEIDIKPDRKKAKDNALALHTTSDTIIYSNVLGHNNHLSAAAVVIDENKQVVESS